MARSCPALTALTDAELLRRAAREPEAFLVVRERWAGVLHGWARRRTGDETQAADVVAETFAEALQHAGRFRDEVGGSAGPWLFGIAANVLRRAWRRAETEGRARGRLGRLEPDHVDPGYDAAERRADADALAPHLHAALADLPAEQREAVRLRVVEELSYDEVAARLACSNDAARLRVSRGLRRMRLRLLALTLLTFLALAAVAVATGVLPLPHAAVRGAPHVVTALDARGHAVAVARCPARERIPADPLCRLRAGAGPPVAQAERRLRAARAAAGVDVTATFCAAGRCRALRHAGPDVGPGAPGVTTYHRTGTRTTARDPRTGGFRGTRSSGVTHLTVPGRPRVACERRSGGPARCRALRAALHRTPPHLARLARDLGVRWAILEVGTRCRLAAHLRCRGIPLTQARRQSGNPLTIAREGTTVSYARTVVVDRR